jgi:hypothetical protein
VRDTGSWGVLIFCRFFEWRKSVIKPRILFLFLTVTMLPRERDVVPTRSLVGRVKNEAGLMEGLSAMAISMVSNCGESPSSKGEEGGRALTGLGVIGSIGVEGKEDLASSSTEERLRERDFFLGARLVL